MILILGQEIKSGEKSGRVREKTGSQLDLAGQGARRQTGYSPWGCKELDTTEHTHTQKYIYVYICIK